MSTLPSTTEWESYQGVRLLPFQVEDVVKLKDIPAVLIGNEMGTGKTYEAIARDLFLRSISKHYEQFRTLIVAPLTILISVWEQHLHELVPTARVLVMDNKNRGAFLSSLAEGEHDYYVVHWEGVRICRKELGDIFWEHVIADEVHRAKNRKAQQTRALKSLRAVYKTGLSGTPVLNKPHDLWSILHWLYPREWSSYWRFYNHFVDYMIIPPQGYHKILGPRNEKELQTKISPYFVRRLKRDVLQDLPEKYYTRIEVDLTPQQRKVYNQMKEEMIAWLDTQDGTRPLVAPVVIAQLIRLQQFALGNATIVSSTTQVNGATSTGVLLTEPSSKVDTLMELVDDNPEEPIVVFSQFKQAIGLVERRLQARGTRYSRITGDDSAEDRRRAVDDFQNGRTSIFLGTIGAGSEGITLTRSSTVVFLDRDWTPARNSQAEDRLHRIGQRNAVQVIDIIARRTVDAERFRTLEMKKEWIRRMLND